MGGTLAVLVAVTVLYPLAPLQAAAVDPVLDLTCFGSVRESMAELGGP
ncbi:hypothetical protein CASFOL_039987 [Castilleja foliolosa]|uniref:Uncharacterized protein n=1 Tax=Castilleja foliolosa TaxID=1961234 RepID=A0ABD3BH58_9LAMI